MTSRREREVAASVEERLAALERDSHPPARDVVSGAEFDDLERVLDRTVDRVLVTERRLSLFGWLLGALAVMLALLTLAGCSGARPFLEVGSGYGYSPVPLRDVDTGEYVDQNDGVGLYGVGVEFEPERWWHPSSCGYRHRSYLRIRPEVVTDTLYCERRFYGARMR